MHGFISLVIAFTVFVPSWTSVDVVNGNIEVKTNIPISVEYNGLTYRVENRLSIPTSGGMVTVKVN